MNKIKKFSFAFIFVLIFVSQGISYAADYYYATTDMTFAEFYAGETGQTSTELLEAGLDAISSPTRGHTSRFPLIITSENEAGSIFSGVKGVQVRMTEEMYNTFSNDVNARTRQNGLSRYTFTDKTFTEYKDVISKDTFSAMVEAETTTYTSQDAAVTLRKGADSSWGNYMLVVSGVAVETGENLSARGGYADANNLLGGTVTASDGTVYALRVDNNLWSSSSDIAFTVDDSYIEIHGQGVKRDYEYTADMAGKTITEIKYMLKDKPDVVISGLSIKLDELASVRAVTPEGGLVAAGENLAVKLSFDNIPDGVSYSEVVSVQRGGGRGAVTLSADVHYEYDDSTKILTLINPEAGFHRITFKASDENYSNIRAGFYVQDAHYAVTDMTWAEFYAGEIEKTAAVLKDEGLDAYSSATTYNYRSFPLVSADVITSADNKNYTIYYGLKDVQVRIPEDVYAALADTSRYTFINAGDTSFKEYKEVTAADTFGKMVTESTDISDAVVTVTSGASSTWGSYTINIRSADIDLGVLASDSGHGTARNLLGAIIETKEGNIYGMRPNSNTFSELAIALTVNDEYVETHGADNRPYEYTADLPGQTITKITYMLKDLPDVVINCEVPLKKWPETTVTAKEPENGFLLTGGDLSFDISFENLPSGVVYDKLSSVYIGSGRSRTVITASCDYSEGVLTIKTPSATGDYTAVFATDDYVDIKTTFTLYTTVVNNLVMSDANNGAELLFLTTPSGALSRVDDELAENNFVNAIEYTTPSNNSSAVYNDGENEITNSGFSFDVILNNVSSGTAILGFSKTAALTSENIGSRDLYEKISETVKTFESIEEGGITYYIVDSEGFKKLGISVKSVNPSRDLTDFASAGAYFNDGTLYLTYGAMLADSASITEGVYDLSPEGEMLLNDGSADGHIKAVWYLAAEFDDVQTDAPEPSPSTPSTPVSAVIKAKMEMPNSTVQENVKKADVIKNIAEAIEEALGSSFSLPDNVKGEIKILPEAARGGYKNLTASQIAPFITASEDNPVELETISVDAAGIYLFKVPEDILTSGFKIFVHMLVPDNFVTGAFKVAEKETDSAVFINDSGEVIDTVPEDKDVNIAAYLQADTEYTPVVTEVSESSSGNIGGSGGGCNAVNSWAILMLLAAMLKISRS